MISHIKIYYYFILVKKNNIIFRDSAGRDGDDELDDFGNFDWADDSLGKEEHQVLSDLSLDESKSADGSKGKSLDGAFTLYNSATGDEVPL